MFFEKLFNNKIFKTCIISMFIVIIFFVTCAGTTVSATTEYMSFNLWDKYRNAVDVGFEYGPETGYTQEWETAFTNNNSVSLSADNITTIKNNEPIVPSSDYYNYVNNFAISVPTTRIEPVFYISDIYLNKPIKFTFLINVKIYGGSFRNSHGNNYPQMYFYVGSSVDDYKTVNVETFPGDWRLTSSTLYYKFDASVTFTETNFICGFHFKIGDPSGIGIYLNGTYPSPSFDISYTLSPLVFSNDISASDIGNSVGEALKEQQENEKQEATQTGDDSVNQVLGGVPDFSSSWTKNFELLADSFAYEGTDFSLTWPEFNIPSLNVNGVRMGPFKVWDSHTIDVEKVIVDVMPSVLLKIAQILFTIALSLFCVIEVMDIVLGVLSSFKVRVKG